MIFKNESIKIMRFKPFYGIRVYLPLDPSPKIDFLGIRCAKIDIPICDTIIGLGQRSNFHRRPLAPTRALAHIAYAHARENNILIIARARICKIIDRILY